MEKWSGRFVTWYRSALGSSLRNFRLSYSPSALPGRSGSRPSSTLVFIQANDQADIAAFAVGSHHPFGLVHQRLNEEHAHPARVFFAVHLAVDIRLVGQSLEALAVVDYLDFERSRACVEFDSH